MLSEQPDIGPGLAAAQMPSRMEVLDVGLVLHVRPAADGEDGHLWWTWDEKDVDWEPRLRLAMRSDVANRFLQGRENFAIAVARRRIRISGDTRAVFGFIPMARKVVPQYRTLVEQRFPHLAL
ncbi:MAG TPA: hypothetical protein VD931_12085 [Baekduia sp.]|nr:hypothetical protein [Baekduia sp.]